MSQPDRAAELRRLRAALGARAAELLADPAADPAQLLADELRLSEQIVTLTDPAAARARLLALWHDLRLRTTALAADLPPTADSTALLSHALGEREGLAPRRDLSPEDQPGARGIRRPSRPPQWPEGQRSPLSSPERLD